MGRQQNALMALALLPLCASAWDSRGEIGLEQWSYRFPGVEQQAREDLSSHVQLEIWQHSPEAPDTTTLKAFYRADEQDRQRTHGDIRDASWIHVGSGYEFRGGIRQVFWGVTEGEHLVDIINQTDFAENIDGKQKLGQPMLNLSLENGIHTLDLLVLPVSRQRTFPGEEGRLRLPWIVDTDLSRYQSSQGSHHVDYAARWQINTSNLRVGLSGFSGTAREPELQPVLDLSQLAFAPLGFRPGYQPVLAPYYPLINQVGLDAQLTQGDLLWKVEAVAHTGGLLNYHASDMGLEYTQVGAFGSGIDVGWLAEYLFDSRKDNTTTPFAHDILIGWRFAFNDPASTELLTSLIVDDQTHERVLTLEMHHRIGDAFRLDVESWLFGHTLPPQTAIDALAAPDFTHKLRPYGKDDFLRLELSWFY